MSGDARSGVIGRVITVELLVGFCALGVTRVFQRSELAWLAVIPLATAIVGILIRRLPLRLVAHIAVIVASGVVASALVNGSALDAADGVLNGWSKFLSTTWPSPTRPELVAFAAIAVALAAVVSFELALSGRWRSVLLLPALGVGALSLVLSAALGPLWWGWFAGAALLSGAVLIASVPGGARLGVLGGEIGALGLAGVCLAVAIGATSAVDALERSDPRSVPDNDVDRSTAINPLSQVVAQRSLSPAQQVMRVTDRPDSHLRLLALEKYDGVQWSLAPTFAAVGRTIRPADTEPSGVLEIEVINGSLNWVPVVGEPREIDRDAAADPERSMLFVDPPIEPGTKVRVSIEVPELNDGVLASANVRPALDDDVSETLSAAAIRLAGPSGSMYERLRRLEQTMRDTFELDRDGPAGVNAGLIRLFVETTRQGTEEQFVAAFTTLAQALGARSRIAVGYIVPDDTDVVLTSDARAWPEVWFEGVGWVPFDPTPERTVTNLPGAVSQVGPGSVPIPPIAQSPPVVETATVIEPAPESSRGFTSGLIRAATISGALIASGLVAVLVAITVIVALKRRRRRRRLRARRSADRVVGAWAEATDTLVDYGAAFRPAQTNLDVAHSAAMISRGNGCGTLKDLADLADEAAHSRREPDDLTVAHAIRLLGQVEQNVAERHRRAARLKAKVALRSLASSGRALSD